MTGGPAHGSGRWTCLQVSVRDQAAVGKGDQDSVESRVVALW